MENRKQLSQKEIRANFNKDKRKPLSVRARTKLNAVTAMFAGLFLFYMLFSAEVLGFGDKDVPADIAIICILGLGMFISGFIWMMNMASYKMEPDDEMSIQTRYKAAALAFLVWYSAVALLLMLTERFKKGSVSALFGSGNFIMIFMSGILTYNALRHFAFLILDKPEKADPEEE